MENLNLLLKIQQNCIRGMGGSLFPTFLKWKRFSNIKGPKYAVMNVSEGEPGIKKDFYLLENFTLEVFEGFKLLLLFFNIKKAWINIQKPYFLKLNKKLMPYIGKLKQQGFDIKLFLENPTYIGGETGTILNSIERKLIEPRPKKPSPSIKGIFGIPTIVHNPETLYKIYLVSKDKYKQTRFATITGDVKNPGVYEVGCSQSIIDILEQTKNLPDFNFFAQIGGNASGIFFDKKQLFQITLLGSGGIRIFNKNTDPIQILTELFSFYKTQSCGKCTPCRQGTFELFYMFSNNKINWQKVSNIINALDKTSFCNLGRSLPPPVLSLINNIMIKNKQYKHLETVFSHYETTIYKHPCKQ